MFICSVFVLCSVFSRSVFLLVLVWFLVWLVADDLLVPVVDAGSSVVDSVLVIHVRSVG